MNTRIRQITKNFPARNIDAFLITKDVNIRYLTNFPASESWLLVHPGGSAYITDGRYLWESQKGLKSRGVRVRCYKDSLEREVFEIARRQNIHRLGFDERHVSLARYQTLKNKAPRGLSLIPTQDLVEREREVKDKIELQKIRKALKIHGRAHLFLKKIIKPGRTERFVLDALADFVRSQNANFSFAPIAASGPNSCFPHARVTHRRICRNDLVLLDMGIEVDGYKSDLTRIFFLGKISRLAQSVYESVSQAQHQAIQSIKAGVPVAKVDHQARNYLAKRKLAKFFSHALGHGVGLEIHESPRLSQRESAVLREGMVVTVEPAVYIPNKLGIRIEDMVLVTREGCEVLSDNIH